MAYTESHYVLRFGGQLGNSLEEWSTGLRMRGTGGAIGTLADMQGVAAAAIDDIAVAVFDFVAGGTYISNKAFLDYIKFNAVGPTGLQDPTLDTNEFTAFTGGRAAGSAQPGPWQVSLVASLRTAAARGRAHSGRMYLPAGALGVDNGGLAPATAINDLVADTAELIGNLNDLVTGASDLTVAVFSNLGVTRVVTGVQADQVYDTQRRRAKSLSSAIVGPTAV